MDREALAALMAEHWPIRKIAARLGSSYSNTRYWLDKYGLRTRRVTSPQCVICQRSYGGRRCPSCDTKVRRVRNRIAAIQYLGGCCFDCGLKACLANMGGFDFHHLDSEEKDFRLGSGAHKSWRVVVRELKKCVLLCARCHRLRHSDIDPKMVEEARAYHGPNDEVNELISAFFRDQGESNSQLRGPYSTV